MFLTDKEVVCVIPHLCECNIQCSRTLDSCVNELTSHPDVPTKAAICAAVLPTELTTSVSAPASNIIHVISVLPTGTEEEEWQHIQGETFLNNRDEIINQISVMIIIKFNLSISPVRLTAYLTGQQTSALCIHVRVHCNSHLLRVAAATCTCLLFLCRRHAWEGSSHTDETEQKKQKKDIAQFTQSLLHDQKLTKLWLYNKTSISNTWFWQVDKQ